MDQKTKEFINNEISNNEVCLFMKGTPDAPQCGFSMAVTNMLKILEVNFKGINVLEDEKLRQGIKEFSDWPTIPQLYIKKEFVVNQFKKLICVCFKGICDHIMIKHYAEIVRSITNN